MRAHTAPRRPAPLRHRPTGGTRPAGHLPHGSTCQEWVATCTDHPGVSLKHRGTPLFDSLMEDFIADGNTVFTEQSLAKGRSSRCGEAFDLHIAPTTSAVLTGKDAGNAGCTLRS